MFGLGIWELVVLLLIVLVVFGAKRLPEIGASLGEGIREFKESIGEIGDEERREIRPGDSGPEGCHPTRRTGTHSHDPGRGRAPGDSWTDKAPGGASYRRDPPSSSPRPLSNENQSRARRAERLTVEISEHGPNRKACR